MADDNSNQGVADNQNNPHAGAAAAGAVVRQTLAKTGTPRLEGAKLGVKGLAGRVGWWAAAVASVYDVGKAYNEHGLKGAGIAAVDATLTVGASALGAGVGAAVVGGAAGFVSGGFLAAPGAIAGGLGGGYAGYKVADNYLVPWAHKAEALLGFEQPSKSENQHNIGKLLDQGKDLVTGVIPSAAAATAAVTNHIPGMGEGAKPPAQTAAPPKSAPTGATAPATPAAGATTPPAAPADAQSDAPQSPAVGVALAADSTYSLFSKDNFGNSQELAKQMQASLQNAKDGTGKLYTAYDDVKAADASKRDVLVMQHYLQDNGFMPKDAKELDGMMGPKTRTAVQAFLKAKNPDYAGPTQGESFDGTGALPTDRPRVAMYTNLIDNGGLAATPASLPAGPSNGRGQLRAATAQVAAPTPNTQNIPPNVKNLWAILGDNMEAGKDGQLYAVIPVQGSSLNSVEYKNEVLAPALAKLDPNFDPRSIDTNTYRTAVRIPLNAIDFDAIDGVKKLNNPEAAPAPRSGMKAQQSATEQPSVGERQPVPLTALPGILADAKKKQEALQKGQSKPASNANQFSMPAT